MCEKSVSCEGTTNECNNNDCGLCLCHCAIMSADDKKPIITTCTTRTDSGVKATITSYSDKSSKVATLTNHVHTLQSMDKASYYLYTIPCKAKLRCNDGQLCNLVQIELYTINYAKREHVKPTREKTLHDLMLYVDEGCNPSTFISAKLAFLVKKKKTQMQLTETFFVDACVLLKSLKFDNVSIKEFWMHRNNTADMLQRAIRNPMKDGKVTTIIFDVSYSFAQDFVSKSVARHEIHPQK